MQDEPGHAWNVPDKSPQHSPTLPPPPGPASQTCMASAVYTITGLSWTTVATPILEVQCYQDTS